jgi:protein-serine/threonine kinase
MGNIYCPAKRQVPANNANEHLTDDLRNKMSQINFKNTRSEASDPIRLKTDILKDYRIVRKIGKGLFSKVYLAIDPSGRKVGLKTIQKKNFVAKEGIEKIIIEKEILKLINHRNVLKLYKTMQTTSRIYFVLEYADKGNLLNIVNTKKLSPDNIRVILAQVIDALFYLHSKGIIYGDLKAENILVNKVGEIKLCDFNLSGTSSLLSDTIQGTVSYIAPEILEGKERTPLSDFWSLGVLTHLLFYKKLPFKSSNQTELFFNIINKNIEPESREKRAPKALRQLICDLLVKNPNKRIGASIKDFVRHPFFENFDWKNYAGNHKNFSYAEGIACIDDHEDLDFSDSGVGEDFLPLTHNSNFMYHLEDFTYENGDIEKMTFQSTRQSKDKEDSGHRGFSNYSTKSNQNNL